MIDMIQIKQRQSAYWYTAHRNDHYNICRYGFRIIATIMVGIELKSVSEIVLTTMATIIK